MHGVKKGTIPRNVANGRTVLHCLYCGRDCTLDDVTLRTLPNQLCVACADERGGEDNGALTGYRALAQAVIFQAISDAAGNAPSRAETQEAIEFLFSESRADDLRYWIRLAGVIATRRKLKMMVESYDPKNPKAALRAFFAPKEDPCLTPSS